MEKKKVLKQKSFPIITLENKGKISRDCDQQAKKIKELYYTPRNDGLVLTTLSRGAKKTIIKIDKFPKNKNQAMNFFTQNTTGIPSARNSFSSGMLNDNFNRFNSLLNQDHSVSRNMNMNIKSSLPSLTTSIESDKCIKAFNAIPMKIASKFPSEDTLILSRLRNRAEYGSLPSRNNTTKDLLISTDRNKYNKTNTCINVSSQSKRYTVTEPDGYEGLIPLNMNFVNSVSPKSDDKKVEINFNQYDIKILQEQIKKTRKSAAPSSIHLDTQGKKEGYTTNTTTTTTTIQKQNNNQKSTTPPKKFLVSQTLPKSFVLKLDNKDKEKDKDKDEILNLNLNCQKNNNENISISISKNNENEKEKGNDATERNNPNEKNLNKVVDTDSSVEYMKKNVDINSLKNNINLVEIKRKEEEKNFSEEYKDKEKDKTKIDSNCNYNYKQLIAELSKDSKSKEKFFRTYDRKATVWQTKNFITQLSKISEQSNKMSKDCDSNSFEKSGKDLIQIIAMSNSPKKQRRHLLRARTIVQRLPGGTCENFKFKPEKKNKPVKKALSMKISGKKSKRLTLSFGWDSFGSSGAFSKKNNTIYEKVKSKSSSILSDNDTPRKPKIVRQYSTNRDFKRRASFISIASIKGTSLQRPRSVHSNDSFTLDMANKNTPKILKKFSEEIREREDRIESACTISKVKFLDKAINKIIYQFEKEVEKQIKIGISKLLIDDDISVLSEKTTSEENILIGNFYLQDLKSVENKDINLDLGMYYKNSLMIQYFDVNIIQKIFIEGYLLHDFDIKPKDFHLITLFDNFKFKRENISLLDTDLRKTRGTFKPTTHKLSLLKYRQLICGKANVFSAIGENNLKYCNRYLLLDTVDQDGTNKLSIFDRDCDDDRQKILLKPNYIGSFRRNQQSPNATEAKKSRIRQSISSEGEPDLALNRKNFNFSTPYFKKRQRTSVILQKSSLGENDVKLLKRNSLHEKSQTFISPGSGFMRGCTTHHNDNSYIKKWSLLKKDFFSRTRDDETNQEFSKIAKQMKILNGFLQKRRTTLLNAPLKSYQEYRKEETNERFVQKLNKESMLFRTYEIKSNLLNKYKDSNKELFFYVKDDNFEKFKEYMEKHQISTEISDDEGNTFLNLAAQCNSFQIANYLIACGADVNTQNSKSNTPLHYALTYKNFKVSDLLVQSGADETRKNIYGLTPWQCLSNINSII